MQPRKRKPEPITTAGADEARTALLNARSSLHAAESAIKTANAYARKARHKNTAKVTARLAHHLAALAKATQQLVDSSQAT